MNCYCSSGSSGWPGPLAGPGYPCSADAAVGVRSAGPQLSHLCSLLWSAFRHLESACLCKSANFHSLISDILTQYGSAQ
ncbi:hypothetical protein Tco_1173389 [Tanacetum coccineum]